jgi:prepilin-type N-terminal cleavage/methylation domain-containing protein
VLSRKNKKGFTLVELCITVFVLGFILLAMARNVSLVLATSVSNKERTVAINLLQSQMEILKDTSYSALASGNDTATTMNTDFIRTWTVTPSGNMKTINITIRWKGKSISGNTVISQS